MLDLCSGHDAHKHTHQYLLVPLQSFLGIPLLVILHNRASHQRENMLKPITEQERAAFTLKFQFQKAVEELLLEAIDAGYQGYLDVWPEISKSKSSEVCMEVKSKKIPSAVSSKSHPDCARYHVVPSKGYKRIS